MTNFIIIIVAVVIQFIIMAIFVKKNSQIRKEFIEKKVSYSGNYYASFGGIPQGAQSIVKNVYETCILSKGRAYKTFGVFFLLLWLPFFAPSVMWCVWLEVFLLMIFRGFLSGAIDCYRKEVSECNYDD